MAETTKRYWQWDEDSGRFFLSGADGAETIAELDPFVDDDEMRVNLDLIVEAVNGTWHDRADRLQRERDDAYETNRLLERERDEAVAALSRLAKIDPLDEGDLPFIDASREMEARIRFAEAALARLSTPKEPEDTDAST